MGSMILLLILHARQKRVVLEKISIVRRRACCAPAVMLQVVRKIAELEHSEGSPICFVQNNNLVSSRWQSDLLLSKGFDFIPHNIDTSAHGQIPCLLQRLSQPTSRRMRSIPSHLLCRRLQEAVELDNVCWSFCQYRGGPGWSSSNKRHGSKLRRTEIMICGQFPSLAMTLSRSMVSAFPTTSSKVSGRYFSTLSGRVSVANDAEHAVHTMEAHIRYLCGLWVCWTMKPLGRTRPVTITARLWLRGPGSKQHTPPMASWAKIFKTPVSGFGRCCRTFS